MAVQGVQEGEAFRVGNKVHGLVEAVEQLVKGEGGEEGGDD